MSEDRDVVERIAKALFHAEDAAADWSYFSDEFKAPYRRLAAAAVAALPDGPTRVDVLRSGQLVHQLEVTAGRISVDASQAAGRRHWRGTLTPADTALRDALRVHHPIMCSETGPFSGCRCGQVRLGQDVIAHVVEHLRTAITAALTPEQDPS